MKPVVALSTCAVLLLAACTSTGLDQIETYPSSDYTSLVREYGDDKVFGPQAFRVDNNSVVIGLYGSSSCPPQPTKVSIDDKDRINVTMKDYRTACTADYGGPTPYRLLLTDNPSTKQWVVFFDDYDDSAINVIDAR